MAKEIIEVPVLSQGVCNVGVSQSLVTKANGIVFVSGTPPFDLERGKFVQGGIETQTESSLKVVMVRVYASNAGF